MKNFLKFWIIQLLSFLAPVSLHSATMPTKIAYEYKKITAAKFDPKEYNSGIFNSYPNKNGQQVYEWQYPSEVVEDEKLGWKQNPLTTVFDVHRTKDVIIFNAIYNFDRFSRRVVPGDGVPRTRHLIFFGCSYTYGYGINDNQTLPYYTYKNSKTYQAYNYAIGASGPHMMLSLIETTDFRKQIKEKQGVFVYVYIDDHIQRANGFLEQRNWGTNAPVYKKVNGVLKRLGSFKTAEPMTTWFYSFLSKKVNFVKRFKRNFPWITQKHIQYTCDLISRSKDLYVAQYPRSNFFTYVHPLSGINKDLKKMLKEKEYLHLRTCSTYPRRKR